MKSLPQLMPLIIFHGIFGPIRFSLGEMGVSCDKAFICTLSWGDEMAKNGGSGANSEVM